MANTNIAITAKGERALMIGKIVYGLKELHDKMPEEHELIMKLTKDISNLIYQYSTCADSWNGDSEKAEEVYKHIISQF